EQAENTYDVVLTVSMRAIVEGKTAYMAEVHQAGIFTFNGFEPDAIRRATNVFCLRFIFPYASAELSNLISKGGFPQQLLSPVNFEALYEQRLQNAQAQANAADSAQDA
ncbi:MAG: protein-export chaperone SecB, partial [Gammaproteobacteria bacterium]